MDTIDTGLLIRTVEGKPEIWDLSDENFRNREAKERSWEEIASNLYADFVELEEDEKKAIVLKLQKRWKTVRDAFKRSQVKSGSSKCGSETKRQPKYYENLKFLEKNMGMNSVETYYIETDQSLQEIFDKSDMEEEEYETVRAKPRTENSAKSRSSKKEYSIKHSEAKFEDDRNFLDSLLPTMGKFNEEQSLQFRIEVLNALQRVKNLFPEQHTGRTVQSFVLEPNGELKEEPKKRPLTAAERMRKMRERRRLEANLLGKKQTASTAGARLLALRQQRMTETVKSEKNSTASISKDATEMTDNQPCSKKMKVESKTSFEESTESKGDSVISIWTELLGHKLQEFDRLTREYLMNETDNNVFKAKIKMIKENRNQSRDRIAGNNRPIELRYVDISSANFSVSPHEDQLSLSPTDSVPHRKVNECEIVYVDPPESM